MRIAIPVDGTTLESPVCMSFGRTETFLLIDTDTLAVTSMPNAAANAQGGAGVVAAQALVDAGVQAVVARYMGKNAADVLTPAGIALYKGEEGTAAEMVEKFKSGRLQILTDIHPGHHHGG